MEERAAASPLLEIAEPLVDYFVVVGMCALPSMDDDEQSVTYIPQVQSSRMKRHDANQPYFSTHDPSRR